MVADKKLLLMAICVLSQWTLEQVTSAYRLTEAEVIRYLVQPRPHQHHRVAPPEPLPPEAGQDLPLASPRAGHELFRASTLCWIILPGI